MKRSERSWLGYSFIFSPLVFLRNTRRWNELKVKWAGLSLNLISLKYMKAAKEKKDMLRAEQQHLMWRWKKDKVPANKLKHHINSMSGCKKVQWDKLNMCFWSTWDVTLSSLTQNVLKCYWNDSLRIKDHVGTCHHSFTLCKWSCEQLMRHVVDATSDEKSCNDLERGSCTWTIGDCMSLTTICVFILTWAPLLFALLPCGAVLGAGSQLHTGGCCGRRGEHATPNTSGSSSQRHSFTTWISSTRLYGGS